MTNALKVKKEKTEVTIYTQGHRIEGEIHPFPGARLTDFMNAKTAFGFIAVTNAKVYSYPEDKLIHSVDFLNINKNFIVMVLPHASEE